MSNQSIREALEAMIAERDWEQFHTVESLIKSISIEAGELLELIQWDADVDAERLREELADVLTYCHLLASKCDLDPDQIVLEKLEMTKVKYPADKSRGKSTKYDQLPD